MKGIDIAIIVFLLWGVYGGYKNGFIIEVFSLLALVLGVLGGFKLMGLAMVYLGDKFNVDQHVLPYIAFAFVFVLIVIAVNLLGRLLKASVSKTFLGQADLAVGAMLGLIKTTFSLSIVFWVINSLKFELPQTWTEDALLYPLVANVAPRVTEWIGHFIPFFKDLLG